MLYVEECIVPKYRMLVEILTKGCIDDLCAHYGHFRCGGYPAVYYDFVAHAEHITFLAARWKKQDFAQLLPARGKNYPPGFRDIVWSRYNQKINELKELTGDNYSELMERADTVKD